MPETTSPLDYARRVHAASKDEPTRRLFARLRDALQVGDYVAGEAYCDILQQRIEQMNAGVEAQRLLLS